MRLLEDKVGNKVAKGEPENEVNKRVRRQGAQREKDILNRVMAEVDGFKDAHFRNDIPIIALAD